MKLFGWLFLALLAVIQLIAWVVFGKAQATAALALCVFPGSVVCGAAFVWFFYSDRGWLWLPLMLLVVIQVEVSHSSRYAPHSALLDHAMSSIFDRKIAAGETDIASYVLLAVMFILAGVSAYVCAEIYGLSTGRKDVQGKIFFRDVGRAFAQWDKSVAGGKRDEK